MQKSMNGQGNSNAPLVEDLNKILNIFKNINWSFTQKPPAYPFVTSPFNCRKYHWFPSTFIPEIPFTLIEIMTLPNAVIYDPFAGIGTTYFQALLLNRIPLATESCNVSVQYMQSLFNLFNPDINLNDIRNSLKSSLGDFMPLKDYSSDVPSNILIDNLRPWYTQKALNELSYLFIKEYQCDDMVVKSAMRIAISSILKNVCRQDRGWGCIADNVLPKSSQIKEKRVFFNFNSKINQLINDLSLCLRNVNSEYKDFYAYTSKKTTIFHADARSCDSIPDESVDLIITSPPYPNMTDYVTSQRLSYYFMGFNLESDLKLEIGARIKRFRKDSVERYLCDMQMANQNICKKLKPGGYACYVLPYFNKDNINNCNRRKAIEKFLTDLKGNCLVEEAQFERIIPAKRRSQNIKWATLELEKIHLFRKDRV